MIGGQDFSGIHRCGGQIGHVAFPPGNLVSSIKDGLIKKPGRALGLNKPCRFHLVLVLDDPQGFVALLIQPDQVTFGAFGVVLPHGSPIPFRMLCIGGVPDRFVSILPVIYGRFEPRPGGHRVHGGAISRLVVGVVVKLFGQILSGFGLQGADDES